MTSPAIAPIIAASQSLQLIFTGKAKFLRIPHLPPRVDPQRLLKYAWFDSVHQIQRCPVNGGKLTRGQIAYIGANDRPGIGITVTVAGYVRQHIQVEGWLVLCACLSRQCQALLQIHDTVG